MNPLRTLLSDTVTRVTALGYVKVKAEIDLYEGGYSSDSFTLTYYDLLDEYHSIYVRREDGDTDADWSQRVILKLAELRPAADALRADAATMVQRVRQKLLDAGFESEAWMAELRSIVEQLSANALSGPKDQ
jgi:hypothetical protein